MKFGGRKQTDNNKRKAASSWIQTRSLPYYYLDTVNTCGTLYVIIWHRTLILCTESKSPYIQWICTCGWITSFDKKYVIAWCCFAVRRVMHIIEQDTIYCFLSILPDIKLPYFIMGCNRSGINRVLHACRLLNDWWRHAHICDVTLQLQYHYASMKMNATPIDSMLRNGKKTSIWCYLMTLIIYRGV